MLTVALVYDKSQFFLVAEEVYLKAVRVCFSVYKAQILRYALVEDESSYIGFYQFARIVFVFIHPYLDFGMDAYYSCLVRHEHFVQVGKYLSVTFFCV